MFNKFVEKNTLFDSHCHINANDFDKDRDDVVKRAVKNGITKIIDVAVDIDTARRAFQNSTEYPEIVYPTVGLIPEVFIPGGQLYKSANDQKFIDDFIAQAREMLSKDPDTYVMVGECGIDLYWLRKNKIDEQVYNKSKQLQIELFTRQVQLAKEFSLPLSIHNRKALDDSLKVIKPHVGEVDGVMHSFTGDYEQLKIILNHGLSIGINGIVTYQSAVKLREALKKVIGSKTIKSPRDLYRLGIFLETDSPYLSPDTTRGQRNEPESLKVIYDFICQI